MTLSLSAAVQFSQVPTVKLVGTSTTGNPNPVPSNTLIDVFRVHADGTSHRVLTDPGPRLIGGAWAWLDVHCPYNQAVTYTITANGSTVTSNPVFLPSKQVWLIHPSQAELSVMVQAVITLADLTADSRSTRFQPIDGKAFYLSEGIRDGVSGSITILYTDAAPLRELLADDSLILINTPGTSGWDIGWMWVQPKAVTYANPTGAGRRTQIRYLTVPFDESADPDVDFQPAWTIDDVTATYATVTALAAAYATITDLVTDTRV